MQQAAVVLLEAVAPMQRAAAVLLEAVAPMQRAAAVLLEAVEPMQRVAAVLLEAVAPMQRVAAVLLEPVSPMQRAAAVLLEAVAPMQQAAAVLLEAVAPMQRVAVVLQMPKYIFNNHQHCEGMIEIRLLGKKKTSNLEVFKVCKSNVFAVALLCGRVCWSSWRCIVSTFAFSTIGILRSIIFTANIDNI